VEPEAKARHELARSLPGRGRALFVGAPQQGVAFVDVFPGGVPSPHLNAAGKVRRPAMGFGRPQRSAVGNAPSKMWEV
jgi:hypothetical protein